MEGIKMTAAGQHDLVRVWITVTDADGRSRLESRWTSAEPAEPAVPLHATHAA